MIELKTPNEIDWMRITGRFVAEVLTELSAKAAVGVNLLDLEYHARQMITDRGAQSCYWDYHPSFGSGPFRNVICLSVNDAVLHGLPFDYLLCDGDVLSMDFAVSIDGWVADAARTIVVGTAAEADMRLISATEEALEAGIAAAQPGGRLGDISAAIGAVADGYGYPSTPISADMAWAAPCTRRPMFPIAVGRAVGSRFVPDSPLRSSRGSRARVTESSTTPTAGPSARPTARAPRIPSTRSRSPPTARWCSPADADVAPCGLWSE